MMDSVARFRRGLGVLVLTAGLAFAVMLVSPLASASAVSVAPVGATQRSVPSSEPVAGRVSSVAEGAASSREGMPIHEFVAGKPKSAVASPAQSNDGAGAVWFFDGFESGSVYTYWDVIDSYTWGASTRANYSGSYSAWCLGSNAAYDYPADYMARMVRGPYDLSGSSGQTVLEAQFWLESEATYDFGALLVSTDGSNYYGSGWSGMPLEWQLKTLNLSSVYTLGNVSKAPRLWVMLKFESDSSTTAGEGVYMDDVQLRDTGTSIGPATLSLSASSLTPNAGSPVTLSGTLSSSGLPVSSAVVRIQQSKDGSGFTDVLSLTTDSLGYYSSSVTPDGDTYYRAVFDGSASYSAATSPWAYVRPPKAATALVLSASTAAPRAGDLVTFSAMLTKSGAALSGATVLLKRSTDNVNWTQVGSGVSNSGGGCSISDTPVGNSYYRAFFEGDSASAASQSSALYVTPNLRAASVTLVGPSQTPNAGSPFSVTGQVTSGGSGASGVPVKIQKSPDNATWEDIATASSDSAGGFTASVSLPTRGYLRAVTLATATYGPATSTSVLVVPGEGDDSLGGAVNPTSWPVSGSIRDTDDPRDVYRVSMEAGKVVDLSLTGGSTGDFALSVLPIGAASVSALPIESVTSGTWPRVISLDVGETGIYYVVVTRQSGFGSYTLSRTVRWRGIAVMNTSDSTVDYGESVDVAATLGRYDGGTPPIRALVSLGDQWGNEYLSTEVDAPNGLVEYSFTPTRQTQLVVQSVQNAECAQSEWSLPVTIKVKPLYSRTSASKYSVRRGSYFTVRGTMRPAHPRGAVVWVKAQRFSASGRLLGSPVRIKAKVTSSSGQTSKFSGRMRLKTAGRYSLAAYQNADGDHVAGKATQWSARPVIVR